MQLFNRKYLTALLWAVLLPILSTQAQKTCKYDLGSPSGGQCAPALKADASISTAEKAERALP